MKKQRVQKKKVKDLRKALRKVDDEKEVVLAFYYKGEVHHMYLAEISTNMKYDGVIKEKLNESSVVELGGYDHDYCRYVE